MDSQFLISTDFDGTLVGHPSDGRCCPGLRLALHTHREQGGLWAVNTGRSLDHIVEGLEIFDVGIAPDYLLTHERDIFEPDGEGGWRELPIWNAECRHKHAELFNTQNGIFESISDSLNGIEGVEMLYENGMMAGLICSDESVMALVDESLMVVRAAYPNFSSQRNTVYLRFCHADYDKGSALRELCGRLRIGREDVFAVGDHFNDLPMLDGRAAAHVACPSNAIPEVKELVRRNDGWIASEQFGEGTAECLAAWTTRRMAAGRRSAWGSD